MWILWMVFSIDEEIFGFQGHTIGMYEHIRIISQTRWISISNCLANNSKASEWLPGATMT